MAKLAEGIHTPEQVQALYESVSGEALNEYLSLMEDSEAPRAYLTWSLICSAAALLGQNARFIRGVNHTIRPNLYVVLIGPPAMRKSSAINMIRRLIESTSINFGPTDTGGQRHGLMSALTGVHRPNKAAYHNVVTPLIPSMLQPRKSSDIFLVSSEFGRLMGSGNREMADFMNDLYEAEPIDYQTKAGETKIYDALASILAATTPSSLASILPETAVTHGIISRFLFIYEDKLYKNVPLPKDQGPEWYDLESHFSERLHWIDNNRTNFSLSAESAQTYEHQLYLYTPILADPRLESYRGRRPQTLLKIAMALAALRNDTTIIDSDLRLAHELLVSSEPRMHKALEYFGKSKVFQGRMLIIEYLRGAGRGGAATRSELVAAAGSELNAKEAEEAIQSMVNSGELYSYGEDQFMLGEVKNVFLQSHPEIKAKGGSKPTK